MIQSIQWRNKVKILIKLRDRTHRHAPHRSDLNKVII